MQKRPELRERVLNGRARQQKPVPGFEVEHRLPSHRIEALDRLGFVEDLQDKSKKGEKEWERVFINRKESKKRQKKKHDGKGKEKIKRVRRLVSFEYRGRTYHVRVPHSYQERQAEVHSSRSLNPNIRSTCIHMSSFIAPPVP